MKTTLVIMAAGIGSRFGGGIKQLEKIGPNGEIIMDYSVHDAIEAGFNKVIFIIRKDIEKDFREVIGDRIEAVCKKLNVETGYAFQDPYDIPGEFPEGRTKPWGTGQAVLAAKDQIDSPFMVINADDYYGKTAYRKIHDFLVKGSDEFCMAGFVLKNTLSEHGGVTRGVCRTSGGYLTDVVETHDIVKTAEGAEANGVTVDVNSHVSMNMWGLTQDYLPMLEKSFEKFFEDLKDPMKEEFLIPVHIGEMLKQGRVKVRVLETEDKWFGVTYQEDKPAVSAAMEKLISDGVYRDDLYSDLF